MGFVGLQAAPASAARAERLTIEATREQLTLPSLPTVGVPFSTRLKLTDVDGNPIGDGSASAMVVGLTSGLVPTPICTGSIVLRLAGGELHLQCQVEFFAPDKTQRGAIIGGTEEFRNATGDFERRTPTPDTVILDLNLTAP